MSEIFTIIDLETTGLDHETDHITEIAAIRTDGTRELGRFHTLVSLPNGIVIPPEITELTGIKTEDLDGAPAEWDALLALEAFAYGTTMVAHNAPFDLAFISRVFTTARFVCTRALSRLVEPRESASLVDVCTRHEIELSGHHRAMNDVEATVKVFEVLRSTAEVRRILYRNIVIDSDERPLRYIPPHAIVRTMRNEAN